MTETTWAYAGRRAADRHTTVGARRHAVTDYTRMTGIKVPDAECGELGYVLLGEWDDTDPLNCATCAQYVAGLVPLLPEEPLPALQLVLFITRPVPVHRAPRRAVAVAAPVQRGEQLPLLAVAA